MKGGHQYLPDQEARDTFATQLDRNFSVLAPAGVGKTTSIVNRIVEIARQDERRADGEHLLPSLVVVTYTNKAADEMLARVRNAIQQEFTHPEISALLNQAFFGTIHRFCQRVISLAGPLVGLPAQLEVTADEDALWRRFRNARTDFGADLSEQENRDFSIHGSWESVFELARKWEAHALADTGVDRSGGAPLPEGQPLFSVSAKGRAAESIRDGQERFRQWLQKVETQRDVPEPLPCPEPVFEKGGKAFLNAVDETFSELREWRRSITIRLAMEVAAAYRDFRLQEQEVTFNDLIYWAHQLVKDPMARKFLRQRNWIMILDEAQDTDPMQFEVFLELARPLDASGDWPTSNRSHPPRPGHFCMVGDPQQSIYSQRADLSYYLGIHRALLEAGGAELIFSVTMRCPQRVVEGLNAVFPRVLCPDVAISRQVSYIPLHTPEGAARGQMLKVRLPVDIPDGMKTDGVEKLYAAAFARWFRTLSLEDLQARSWDQVAILCPRNKWVEALGVAMDAEEVPYRLISRGTAKADSPAYAWPLAVLHVFAHPRDSFELYGVLRDILGMKDSELLRYIETHRVPGKTHPLRLDKSPSHPAVEDPVSQALAGLHDFWVRIQSLPLYEAARFLFEQLALEERIQLHPLVRRGEARNILRKWIQNAAVAEANQLTLADWVRECRVNLKSALDEEEASESGDACVLLTSHKSKGLGWDAVILPFFGREQIPYTDDYPRCAFPYHGVPRVELGKYDSTSAHKQEQTRREREEKERLLYVAMTRTKRSLILIDDLDLWKGGPLSFADCLGLVEGNPQTWSWWNQLPETPEAVKQVADGRRDVAHDESLFSQPPLTLDGIWKRVTPSSLQQHGDISPERDEPDRLFHPEYKEEIRTIDPAAYGNWWHMMMEKAPWKGDLEALRAHCHDFLDTCPKGKEERARREISALLQAPIIHELLQPEWDVWCEVSMLHAQVEAYTAYEGFIDLLAVHRETGEWIVLDWKTDQLPSKEPQHFLRGVYGPQLAVYAQAAYSHFKGNGRCGIFATVSSEWVLLNPPSA